MNSKTNSNSDLQGIVQIIKDSTIGITQIVQAMHHTIVHPPTLPSTPIQNLVTNIAGIAYKNIQWTTNLIGNGLDKTLEYIVPLFGETKTYDEREALISVLNGVVGDYLEENDNPLAIKMQFRYQGKPLELARESIAQTLPTLNGKILLMIHGSSMNDIQWTSKGHNHGETLARDLDKTVVYLNYNSGRHISTNGQELNELLENLILNWSVPVEEITIIAHSMGGLVTRSAFYYGQKHLKSWTKYLQKIVFLGTPHHGAHLERAGNYFHTILHYIPYTKPLARLGKIRSAGVTDLRYGNIVDEDWLENDRFHLKKDQRQHVPLPPNVECYSIAANYRSETETARGWMDDYLVDVKSALGQHTNPEKDLNFKSENTSVFFNNNHFDLLSNPKIYVQIKEWMV
ncbi:MAG TPA: alpha/beta hydrolase [Chitinophagales bacterium]|nr:alpha/beta hydrolase [Chitinophagales bacterium]